METKQLPLHEEMNTVNDHSSNIDTSSPFRSVKEAVAVFGERFLAGDIYSQKTFTIPKQETVIKPLLPLSSPSSLSNPKQVSDDEHALGNTLKKLEAELKEMKQELKLLKERESEMEIELASLNAELHKNMSKMAEAEATAAAKAVATKAVATRGLGDYRDYGGIREETARGSMVWMERSQTLAQVLSLREKEGYFGTKKQRKMMKKKPIIPLLGDIFSRKKTSSTTLHNPLYTSSHMYFN